MKIMHQSRNLLVAEIDPKEVGYVTMIPQYLVMTLASPASPFGAISSKVMGWSQAYVFIKIDNQGGE